MSSEENKTEATTSSESQEAESEADTKSPDKNNTGEKSAGNLKPYHIPKLSTSSSTEDKNTQSAPEDDDVKVTVEEEQGSDTELLVDDTLEVQSEVNCSSDTKEGDKEAKDESSGTKNENGTNEESSQKHSRSRSRSRERHRSRSRSHERRRRERHRDQRDTSSDNPDMIRSRVFVGHLDTDKVTKDEVHRLFAPYGRVIGVALHQGYGFVQYDNADSAKAAIKEAHGTPVAGMKIVVDKTVKLKKMLGEDPKSEPPLPRDTPRRRDRLGEFDLDYYRRRDIESRFSRLEELERRLMMDRYDRYAPPPPPRRDPYFESYYDRPLPPPPSYLESYDRPRYGEYERERERFPARERERFPPDPYYERRRDDHLYDDYPRADPYRHY